jgi:RsiW-degrading membrane proteinase PrsW (M82 family)
MQTAPSHPRGTVAQIVLAIIGILLYGLAGVAFLFSALFPRVASQSSPADRVSSLSFSLVAFSACALMVPSLVHAARPAQPTTTVFVRRPLLLAAVLGLVVWVIVIFLGHWAIRTSTTPWLLPFLQVFAAGLPVWSVYVLASAGLSAGSTQREWGILDVSLSVTPLVILLLEFFLMVLAGLVLLFAILLQPDGLDRIQALTQTLQNLEMAPALTGPLISQSTGLLAGLLVLAALIIPFIEEILKPLGMVVLARRRLTPSQGFVAGLICGAGFAFLETVGFLAGAAPTEWASLAVTRLGTALLHMTGSSLVGWGFASAIALKKPSRFWFAYLPAVALHGTWNALAILMGFFPTFLSDLKPDLQLAAGLGAAAPYALLALSLGMLAVLFLMNRRLRHQTIPPPSLPTIPGL